MDKKSLPPWFKQVWDELTTPPSILRTGASKNDLPPQGKVSEQVEDEYLDEPNDSPTDPDDHPKKPRTSSQRAEILTRKYFAPKRSRRPATKPRPKLRQKTKLRKKSMYSSGDIVTAARNSTAFEAPKKNNRPQSKRPNTSLLSEWEDKIIATDPINGIWRLKTSTGKTLALKESRIPIQRLRWMARVTDELHRQGHPIAPKFLRTKSGEPFIFDGDSLFYVYEWIPGTPLKYDSTRQLGAAAKTLARFYQETSDMLPGFGAFKPYPLIEEISEKHSELIDLSSKLDKKEDADEFDQLFQSQIRSALRQGETSLSLLRSPEVTEEVQEHAHGVCHLDVTSQNLIVCQDGSVQLIDLELMNYAPRVLDLSHLLRRAMQAKGTWSSETAIVPLIAYNRMDPLRKSEYLLLEALLTFPFRLYRLQKNHYQSKTSNQENSQMELYQLKKTLVMESDRSAFLSSFSRQVTRRG